MASVQQAEPPRGFTQAFTFMMGPCELMGTGDGDPWCDPGVDIRGLNAAMLCDTPSAKMNCSRSSMLVRPLADVIAMIDPHEGVGMG